MISVVLLAAAVVGEPPPASSEPRLTHGMDLLAAFQHVEGRPVAVGAIDALTTQRTVRVDLSIRF